MGCSGQRSRNTVTGGRRALCTAPYPAAATAERADECHRAARIERRACIGALFLWGSI